MFYWSKREYELVWFIINFTYIWEQFGSIEYVVSPNGDVVEASANLAFRQHSCESNN